MEDDRLFWKHPLALWIRSCSSIPGVVLLCGGIREQVSCANYLELCNAALLNALMLYIDPRPTRQKVTPCDPTDVSGRMKNLRTFLWNLQSFYQEVLQQLIVMPLPDLLAIARHPHVDGSGEQMNKVLLLLLGCAVQSDKKEEFIEKIKQLEVSLQEAIVEQIQKITNNAECVLNVQALELDPDDKVTTTVLHQLQKVVKERDTYAQSVLELNQEQESDSSSGGSLCNGDVCARKLPEALQHDARSVSPAAAADRHLGVELASMKAELRKARNEVEEKTELLCEIREELGAKDSELGKLQQEKIELVRQARAAKDYKDEIDCLQQKVTKVERLETDNKKLKEKLSEMDFFRQRVEELRQENHILLETRQVLEGQVESWKSRVQQSTDAEVKYVDAQRTIHQLQTEIRQERDRISELLQENGHLEKESQSWSEKSASLERELELMRTGSSTPRANLNSLGDQMNDSERSRILELELDNQKLRSKLEESSFNTQLPSDDHSALLDAEREETQRLIEQRDQVANQLEILNSERSDQRQRIEKGEGLILELRTQLAKCQQQQTNTQDNCTTQVEKVALELAESRARVEDFEKENRLLSQELGKVKQQHKSADDNCMALQESKLSVENKIHTLEREKRCLEKEKASLKEKLSSGDSEFEQLRSRLVDVERTNERLGSVERRLVSREALLSDCEADNKQLSSQVELETRKCARLGDDLVAEKTQTAELNTRMRAICTALGLEWNNAQLSTVDTEVVNRWQEKRAELERLRLECQHKDTLIAQLKLDIDKLHTAQTAEGQEEEKNIKLMDENRNVKEQVAILQERLRNAQMQCSAKDELVTNATIEINELKLKTGALQSLRSEKAALEVSVRSAECEQELLRGDNGELQKQCASLEQQLHALREDFEQLQTMHAQLLGDHEQLQTLHQQLNNDYESVNTQLHKQKAKNHRSSEESDREQQRACEELKALLSAEQTARESELRSLALLQNEHSRVKKAQDQLLDEHDSLTRRVHSLSSECASLKNERHSTQLQHAHTQDKLAQMQQNTALKDLECSKIKHKSEMLEQLNATMEEESRTLLRQMDVLITQNQELLTQMLLDKEHYHTEEKELQEKLNGLRRHKEKLEEKIMDQYKTMGNSTKLKREKQTFVKRAAKALMPKAPTRVKTRNGPCSSTEESSALSADECATYVNGDLLAKMVQRNGGGATSSDELERLSPEYYSKEVHSDVGDCRATSSSSQPESSVSSGHSPTKQETPTDRISWNGSERGVDVPPQPTNERRAQSARRPMGRVSGLPPRPPPSSTRSAPQLPPPRRLPRPAPPPYPLAAKPINQSQTSTPSQSNGAQPLKLSPKSPNSKRPPPPPYPGTRRIPVPPSTDSSPILRAIPATSTIADELFSPPTTSTPKGERQFSFDDNANGLPKFPVDVVQRRGDSCSAERRNVVSLYENLERINSPENEARREENCENGNKRRESDIWYEYGCV